MLVASSPIGPSGRAIAAGEQVELAAAFVGDMVGTAQGELWVTTGEGSERSERS
ncbi:MAG: hypothetical protein IRZ16_19805 [Myxococcaceae bacterium]|nr:hypothetical protein [Myxococcaceae bacterium]